MRPHGRLEATLESVAEHQRVNVPGSAGRGDVIKVSVLAINPDRTQPETHEEIGRPSCNRAVNMNAERVPESGGNGPSLDTVRIIKADTLAVPEGRTA